MAVAFQKYKILLHRPCDAPREFVPASCTTLYLVFCVAEISITETPIRQPNKQAIYPEAASVIDREKEKER